MQFPKAPELGLAIRIVRLVDDRRASRRRRQIARLRRLKGDRRYQAAAQLLEREGRRETAAVARVATMIAQEARRVPPRCGRLPAKPRKT